MESDNQPQTQNSSQGQGPVTPESIGQGTERDLPKSVPVTPKLKVVDSTNGVLDPDSVEHFGNVFSGETPRGKSPDSIRPRSSNSGEILFEAKKKKKKSLTQPNAHTVTFTVNVAMAVPTVEDDVKIDIKEMLKKKKRVFEAPRAQNYYHIEYYLLPEDEEEITKTDLVTYGMAAKIYMERHDPRVIKTWQEGEVTWIAWTNTHSITVTKDLLLKMFNHRIELRVWDTKDKVSPRARFDRPKAFRLPQAKPGEDIDDIGGVKSSVQKQCSCFSNMQPKKGGPVRQLPTTITFPKSDALSRRRGKYRGDDDDFDDDKTSYQGHNDPDHKGGSLTSGVSLNDDGTASVSPNTLMAFTNKDISMGQDVRTFGRLGRLAGTESPTLTTSKDSRVGRPSREKLTTSKAKKGQLTASTLGPSRTSVRSRPSEAGGQLKEHDSMSKKRNKKAEAAAQAAAEHAKKFGICVVPIRMSLLFAGLQSVTGRLEKAIPGIEDVFITVSLDSSLMSDKQKKELNPMIIKVKSATNMPDTPLTFPELHTKCQPVYCKYQFFKQPEHITSGKEHQRNVYWDDINVVLLGTLEKSELREYLNGPAMEIEVHDRDRKKEEIKLKPTLFGDDLEDEKISSVGIVTSRRTLHNPFQGRNRPWDPSGVARVDLSELLLGHRYLYLKIPIHNASIPDVLGGDVRSDGRIIGIAGAVDGPVDQPLPSGHYLRANSTLKVKVELAHPITTPGRVVAKERLLSTGECPFSRIVFIFDYKNVQILHKLQNLVTSINAHALGLDDMPQHVINAAISTYKLSGEQQKSGELDIVTGFQVLDGSMHLFVLEGLRDKAVHVLWEALPQPHHSDVRVLFNSDLSFSSRLYGPLDVDLCRVKLHESLSVITQQSLLYVRDMVPKPCFQALVKLGELCKTQTFKDAVRNELFPTADMVISMSREFGVPLTAEDFEDLQPEDDKVEESTEAKPTEMRPLTSRLWTPIDNFNPDYIERKVERDGKGRLHNYLKENMDDVQQRSIQNKLERARNQPATITADVVTAHNYSSQTLNSTELAKEKLRQMLAGKPDTRYTYCQDFHHSMTVVPVNPEALEAEADRESRSRWRTASGFIYPGKKSMLESNLHPKQPDEARSQELRESWRENLLHVNILQPPLSRDNYPWDYRREDFELYLRPPKMFRNEPITIHSSGIELRDEKLAARSREMDFWKSRIVVDDIRHYVHRCLPETEARYCGFNSSNQIDRLQSLLKNSPAKLTLKKPGLELREIPPLNVVLNPSVDTYSRDHGVPLYPAVMGEGIEKTKGFNPGPFEGRRWQLEKNKIPVFDYEHQKFSSLKGQDFNVYHTNRNSLWKRPIQPLEDADRDNHLFWIPDDPYIWGPMDNTGFDLERSYTQPVIGRTKEVSSSSRSPELKKNIEVVAS